MLISTENLLQTNPLPLNVPFMKMCFSCMQSHYYIFWHSYHAFFCSMSQSQTTGMEECSTGDSSQINFQPLCPKFMSLFISKSFLCIFVRKRREMAIQCRSRPFYSQPRHLSCAWCPMPKPTHLSLSHPF